MQVSFSLLQGSQQVRHSYTTKQKLNNPGHIQVIFRVSGSMSVSKQVNNFDPVSTLICTHVQSLKYGFKIVGLLIRRNNECYYTLLLAIPLKMHSKFVHTCKYRIMQIVRGGKLSRFLQISLQSRRFSSEFLNLARLVS